MRILVALALASTLAACGAESPPFQPEANVGLSVGTNGVSTGASIGASNGTVSLGLNL
ncbi:MAG: hypothetical protein AAGF56_08175 [Pseudomonadota bacterium]